MAADQQYFVSVTVNLQTDGQQYTLRFGHAGTAKDLKCYDFTRITKMALEDYKSRTGTAVKGYIASCDEEGKVEISMFIADTGEDADTYTVNLYSGLGTNQNGEAVNLPQTGNNVPGAAAAAAAGVTLLAAGLAIVLRSSSSRRKKD